MLSVVYCSILSFTLLEDRTRSILQAAAEHLRHVGDQHCWEMQRISFAFRILTAVDKNINIG